jgi:hypothetical protein
LKVLTAISQFDTKRGLIVLMQIEVLEGQEEYGPEVAIMEPAEAILQECLEERHFPTTLSTFPVSAKSQG